MRIQGTPGGSAGVLIDGMTNLAGFLPGDFGEASISPEAIQELNVFTGNVSAEMGRQSGGTMNFTLKSGTNQPHGTALLLPAQRSLSTPTTGTTISFSPRDPNFTNSPHANFLRPATAARTTAAASAVPSTFRKSMTAATRPSSTSPRSDSTTPPSGLAIAEQDRPAARDVAGQSEPAAHQQQVGTDAHGPPGVRRTDFRSLDPSPGESGRYIADPFAGNIIPASRISTVARNYAASSTSGTSRSTTSLLNNMYDTRSISRT